MLKLDLNDVLKLEFDVVSKLGLNVVLKLDLVAKFMNYLILQVILGLNSNQISKVKL